MAEFDLVSIQRVRDAIRVECPTCHGEGSVAREPLYRLAETLFANQTYEKEYYEPVITAYDALWCLEELGGWKWEHYQKEDEWVAYLYRAESIQAVEGNTDVMSLVQAILKVEGEK